jgi:hypothetical protein
MGFSFGATLVSASHPDQKPVMRDSISGTCHSPGMGTHNCNSELYSVLELLGTFLLVHRGSPAALWKVQEPGDLYARWGCASSEGLIRVVPNEVPVRWTLCMGTLYEEIERALRPTVSAEPRPYSRACDLSRALRLPRQGWPRR